jgi:peptidoglycan hydrolase-like protein with peptidoglycan-binding domain
VPVVVPVKFDTIQKGSSGPTVKYLQQKLTALGYAVGNIDGDFGDKTDAALREYQVTHGLKVDGVCGTETWAAIESGKPKVEIPDNVKKEINTDVKGDYLDWKYIIIHHTAGEEKNTEQVREYHKSKGWIDIAYNFVIEKSGKIGVGRSLAIPGAHCDDDGMNKKGIGVVVIGNFDLRVIEDVEYKPLLTTVRYIMQQYGIPSNRVLGHREVLGASTACPGKNINMDALRRDLANFTDTQAVKMLDDYVETNNIVYAAEGDFESGLKGIHDVLMAAAASFIKFT